MTRKTPVWEMSKEKQKDDTTVVFDYDELLEFAEGDIAPVFGPQFKIIDSYRRRVRLPAREYLLVSRVTKMDAEPGEFRVGATMTTEYDLPVNGELSQGGDIPWAVLVESGQCDLMLISYMGIDFQCKGERVYRLLDTTLTFYGVAREGETLVYDIKVNGFAKAPNKETGEMEVSMFFFEYNCYCNGKLLIEMRNGAAGFFDDATLAAGKGVLRTVAEIKKRDQILAKTKSLSEAPIVPYMHKPIKKNKFSESDMQKLIDGKWAEVMDVSRTFTHKIATKKMLMIDRVTHVIPDGGIYGLGLIIGEKELDPNHWYFPCHFVKDQVMAGSLVSDGCSQLLKLYMMWLGLCLKPGIAEGFEFRPVNGQGNKVRCRGQISPHKGKLVYVMEVREMGIKDGEPYAVADVDIIDVDYGKGQSFDLSELESYGKGDLNKKIVVDFKGIGLRLEPAASTGVVKKNPPIEHWKKGDPLTKTVNTWHPLNDLFKAAGAPPLYFTPSLYPPRQITMIPFLKADGSLHDIDKNFTPGELPIGSWNMAEFMCGKVSNCFGDEFAMFDDSATSRSPAFDLAFVTRIVKMVDLERKQTYGVDLNPSKGLMYAEFDVPKDAWFFENGSIPYSILMEIGLQTSGMLTSFLKAPLTFKKKDLLFRNLDASSKLEYKGDLVKLLAGKTIINKTKCLGYNMLGNMGIHRFYFELFIKVDETYGDGDLQNYLENYETINGVAGKKTKLVPFYSGETSFGWFEPKVFESQVGLDNGKKSRPFFEENNVKPAKTYTNVLAEAKAMNVSVINMRQTQQHSYVDTINIVEGSGLSKKGYVHGSKMVDPTDWFFSCHFWNDPVMPGSLGIESMYHLMETYLAFMLEKRGDTSQWKVELGTGSTSWKYRGQMNNKAKRMDSEVHIVSLDESSDKIELVCDGFLFVDDLRVYSTKNLRVNFTKVGQRNGHVAAEPIAIPSDPLALKKQLLNFKGPVSVGGIVLPEINLGNVGDRRFMDFYGVNANLYSGAMAKGIASADLVIAMGKANLLGSLGAGGLPMHAVERALVKIKEELGDNPFAVNLIHSPFDPNLEEGNVELFEKFGVKVVEASAFMNLTPSVVYYRVRGYEVKKVGSKLEVNIKNKLIAKCSRTEVAECFLRPPPESFLKKLLAANKITELQAEAARLLPLADDIAVEADSGGHTDNRQLHVILPLVINLRKKIFEEQKKTFTKSVKLTTTSRGKVLNLSYPYEVRVGCGGGIGCPAAVQAATALGAAFVVTGTINQMARQSGTCDTVRGYLSKASYSDVTMAPAADMFEQGVKLQVLKKGTMFPSRAKKLYDLFYKYNSFDEMPESEIKALEKRILKKTIAEVWEETKDFYINRLHNKEKIDKAENSDPKLKMSLCFRWYLGLSSFWANSGDVSRKQDYQIWCGPAIGAFNDFIQGTYLDPEVSGEFPDVVQANLQVLSGAMYLTRLNRLKFDSRFSELFDNFGYELLHYKPSDKIVV
eukprot:augustus_masked-scaffold_5-processed-gene-9.51-mRNA-1 protein AED:0.01 eAED:0.06 QI:0/-1/0/1/-1/1/1/0/1479